LIERVNISGEQKLSVFEGVISASYKNTYKASHTIFDLSKLSWIGYLPATLLFSWAATLARIDGKSVTIELPPRETLKPQVKKILLEYGIISRLVHLGVQVPYSSSPGPLVAIPLTVISPDQDLWHTLRGTAERLTATSEFPKEFTEIVIDIFKIVVFELAENAFIHASGAIPHYGISFARSASTSGSGGFISTFRPNTQYIEVCIGDIGPGIRARLGPSMPEGYSPPFRTVHQYLKPERLLAYAFEFSTTSDIDRRKARLQELLTDEQLDPNEIATGLFCVLELTRSYGGQFIVRSPEGILSLDFSSGGNRPIVKGKNELGIAKLGRLPGTHYLFRLPLTQVRQQRASTQIEHVVNELVSIDAFDPFIGVGNSEEPHLVLHSVIDRIDKHLIGYRQKEGLSLIMPPRFPLPSRAEALFISAVQSMHHGLRQIIWLNRNAGTKLNRSIELTTSSNQRSKVERLAILVGDIVANTFTWIGEPNPKWSAILELNEASSDTSRLQPLIYADVRKAYQAELRQYLQSIFARPEVRHAPGPFLIEGQYYTEIFFQIARALENRDELHMFSEWALDHLNKEIDVLIAHSTTVFPLVYKVAQLMEKYWGRRPAIIEYDPLVSPAKVMTQTLAMAGRHAAIFTGVICRGVQLRNLLEIVAGLEIDIILSLIDGRSEQESNRPFLWESQRGRKMLDLQVIQTESILAYRDPPYGGKGALLESGVVSDEHVYIIDRRTQAPTLYVRTEKPKLSLSDLLEGPARESSALICGHTEYNKKHYSFFLDFPRLFASLQDDLQGWVRDQVNYVAHARQLQDNSWHACVYNPDGSLSQIIDFLPSLEQHPSVSLVSANELNAPPPMKTIEPRGHWLIILPALASGETVQQCIEYVSRQAPATMLVLCVASRMNPYQLTFLTGISHYRSAQLRMACFLEFPIAAWTSGEDTCPLCTEIAELERLKDYVKRQRGPNSKLVEALNGKISANQAVPLNTAWQASGFSTIPSKRDYERSYIRALYESAAVDINRRRELNTVLEADTGAIDRFLEILASERLCPQFSQDSLDRRLYKVWPNIYFRLQEIICNENPPFPIGRFIGAVIRLSPSLIVTQAVNLIRRFATSRRDVEEICIGLLQVRAEPSDIGEFSEDIGVGGNSENINLFLETLESIRRAKEYDNKEFDESIAAIGKLWSRLSRSSKFSEPLEKLAQTPLERYMEYQEALLDAERMWREWRGEISELVLKIQAGPVWPSLSKRRPDLGRDITRFEHGIANLGLLAKMTSQQVDNEKAILLKVWSTAREVEEVGKKIAGYLYELVVNPVLCEAAKLGDELIAKDGSKLKVRKNIDQTVPWVFCDLQELDSACTHLVDNWQKHKKIDREGGEVWIAVYKEGTFVVLEFGDDIEGDFDIQSEGGLRIVHEFCEAYGGKVQYVIKERTKSLQMFLRMAETSWHPNEKYLYI